MWQAKPQCLGCLVKENLYSSSTSKLLTLDEKLKSLNNFEAKKKIIKFVNYLRRIKKKMNWKFLYEMKDHEKSIEIS